jgi:aspartate beta-hydroxylase
MTVTTETLGAGFGPAQKPFELALAAHNENRLADAEAGYEAALALDPAHAGALTQLGLLRLQQNRPQDGAALLTQALERDPDSADTHNYLGRALQGMGRLIDARAAYDNAISRYEAKIALAPANAQLQLGLASALAASDRSEEAFVRLRNAAALDPRFSGHLQGALNQFAQRHPDLAQAGMQRINRYIGAFLTNQGGPRMGMYPGLTSAPFHDASRLPGALAMEREYPAIRQEIEGLSRREFQAEAEGLKGRGDWDVFLFYERGRKNEENCARCPTIARIIESTNTVRTMAGLLYVSKLGPGTDIKAHFGPVNMRLRCHLGIHVPDGDLGIKVGGVTRKWEEGKCLVFDDSLEHEAWNHTKADRIVLILDFWHPDLTPTEIAYLEGLHRFANFQANSLKRYWDANEGARNKARTTDD